MVTRESAIHPIANQRMSLEVSIPADHSTMVKFDSRSDQNYINVRSHILQLAKDAHDIIKTRFLRGIDSWAFDSS